MIDLQLLKPHIDWLIAEGLTELSHWAVRAVCALEIRRASAFSKVIELNGGRVALWAGTLQHTVDH